MATTHQPAAPMDSLENWDEFLEGRYQEGKSEEEFRQYDKQANPGVAEFYRINHEQQTVDYVLAQGEGLLRADARQKDHLGGG